MCGSRVRACYVWIKCVRIEFRFGACRLNSLWCHLRQCVKQIYKIINDDSFCVASSFVLEIDIDFKFTMRREELFIRKLHYMNLIKLRNVQFYLVPDIVTGTKASVGNYTCRSRIFHDKQDK